MSALVVKSLVPALTADYLRFFDHRDGPAFSDNPEWAKCYCHFYEVPRAIEWSSLSADQNRVAMQSRIDIGEMEGFLAYDGDHVVGWLNAQPRHRLPHCFERLRIDPPPIACEPYQAAVVVCFVVAPSHRRRGVGRMLLRHSIAALKQRGFVLIDAFPFKSGDSTDATDHYHGPTSLFQAEGFVTVRDEESMTVMRKTLV